MQTLRAAVAAHGRVARVVIADVAGSSPREVGAAMLVWPGGQSGTIGGGALEYEAAQAAFSRTGLSRHALGPELGQCCGGAVTLLTEQFDNAALEAMEGQSLIARGEGEMPLAVRRIIDRARARGDATEAQLVQGWFVEPVTRPRQPLWIWGAGHVGRALVDVLGPLPDFAITWADTGAGRFPPDVPDNVTALPSADLSRLAAHAPTDAMHLILTYSHALDLELCHAVLTRGFRYAGLIGSKTKKARFDNRLRDIGHSADRIARLTCPIGIKALGKHPQAIAVGTAAQLLDITRQGDERDWTTYFSVSGG